MSGPFAAISLGICIILTQVLKLAACRSSSGVPALHSCTPRISNPPEANAATDGVLHTSLQKGPGYPAIPGLFYTREMLALDQPSSNRRNHPRRAISLQTFLARGDAHQPSMESGRL